MSNPFFRFKQFIIYQDRCAMKVGIDGVLFGAWIDTPLEGNVLDVGCGTGLLSLMLAQKNPNLRIDALEIDSSAAEQAKENISQSLWAAIIHVFQADFFLWEPTSSYNLIVCNPPFFNPGKPARTIARDIARNERNFSLPIFFRKTASMLLSNGKLAIMVPFDKYQYTCNLAENNQLYLCRSLKVKPVPEKTYHRVFLEFSTTQQPLAEEELTIELNGRHQYSPQYKNLTRDFYLNF